MADVFDKDQRSQIMQKVKSHGNKSTEMKLISVFSANGISGWRRNYPVKGHPDFVGEGCSLELNKFLIGTAIYSAGGFGSENRTTYGVPTAEGVFVRCGCWSGTLDEFKVRVEEEYWGDEIAAEYLLVAALFEARWKREMQALAGGEGKECFNQK